MRKVRVKKDNTKIKVSYCNLKKRSEGGGKRQRTFKISLGSKLLNQKISSKLDEKTIVDTLNNRVFPSFSNEDLPDSVAVRTKLLSELKESHSTEKSDKKSEDEKSKYSVKWYNSHNFDNVDKDLPSESMFKAEEESANTKILLAPSFSGKTTLMVRELNKLTDEEAKQYSKIIIFTESVNATPLKFLSENLIKSGRVLIFDRFVPKCLHDLAKINSETGNRYRFLVFLDDILKLRGDTLIKMILTLRNSNISTVISIQYIKLLTPSQRQSVHDIYAIKLTLPDWEFVVKDFIGNHIRDYFSIELGDPEAFNYSIRELALRTKERMTDRIFHYSQRGDKFEIFKKPEPFS